MTKTHPEKAEMEISTFNTPSTRGAMKGVERKICEHCQRQVWYPNHSEPDCKLYGKDIIKLPKKEGYKCSFCFKITLQTYFWTLAIYRIFSNTIRIQIKPAPPIFF